MKYKIIVKVTACLELLIGSVTLISLAVYSILSMSQKPFNVFIFVLSTSLMSIVIGLGLLSCKDWARKTLVFFSGYIILTKIMIFFNLLRFNGEIITFIPTDTKNIISVIYHFAVIMLLSRTEIKNDPK